MQDSNHSVGCYKTIIDEQMPKTKHVQNMDFKNILQEKGTTTMRLHQASA